MRLFGLDITRQAPKLRTSNTAFADRSLTNATFAAKLSGFKPTSFSSEAISATGELSTYIPLNKRSISGNIESRSVPPDPFSGWWLSLPDKLEPKQVSQILRAALAGNLWQQTQLVDRAMESWPMLRKCVHELRAAVQAADYVVHAYAKPGEKPSDSAEEKADLVRRAMKGFRPGRFTDEDGYHGMIYDLCDSILNGVSIVELVWDKGATDHEGNKETRPRGSAWVHPRHYAFNQDGGIGVARTEPEQMLQFPTQGGGNKPLIDNESKFLVAKYKSKSGSVLSYGLARTILYYWVMIMYGRDFLLAFSQKYGNPFLDIAYQAGIPQSDIDRFESIARRAAAQGYCVHANTGEITIQPAQSLGSDNPIIQMIRMADEAVQYLFLGQTLTTAAPKGGGTRAQGEVHEGVLEHKKNEICQWIAEQVLTEQFAESVLMENYGESSERPMVEVDMTYPLSADQKATMLTAISNSTLPLPIEQVYKLLDYNVPNIDDEVIVRGQHTILEAPKKESERQEEQMELEVRQSNMTKDNDGLAPKGKVKGSLSDILSNASDRELGQLRALLVQAADAKKEGRLNGEWDAIQVKIKSIETKARF